MLEPWGIISVGLHFGGLRVSPTQVEYLSEAGKLAHLGPEDDSILKEYWEKIYPDYADVFPDGYPFPVQPGSPCHLQSTS